MGSLWHRTSRQEPPYWFVVHRDLRPCGTFVIQLTYEVKEKVASDLPPLLHRSEVLEVVEEFWVPTSRAVKCQFLHRQHLASLPQVLQKRILWTYSYDEAQQEVNNRKLQKEH